MTRQHPAGATQASPGSKLRILWHLSMLFAILVLGLGSSATLVSAQTYLQTDGSPTFTTKIPVENGWIDASNGRLHLEIPLDKSAQRGRRSFYLAQAYDSNIWVGSSGLSGTWQPTNGGWTIISSEGNLSYSSHYASTCAEGGGPKWLIFDSWTFVDPSGTLHSFPLTIYENLYPDYCSGEDTPNANAYASDASGYYLTVTDYYDATVYAPDGTQYAYNYGEGLVDGKDSNGNYQGPIAGGYSSSVNGNTTTYTVSNEQSGTGTSAYAVTTATITAKTNFGQAHITECTTSCTLTVVRSIALPDGTSYSFKYDCDKTVDSTDCSSPTGQSAYYGQLTSMMLPSGGTITYSWSVFSDAYSDKYSWISSRTTPDGTWNYSQSVSGTPCALNQVDCQQTFTLAKPSGDNAVYTFALNGGAWEDTVQSYTGSVSSANLQSTVSDCWNFVTITNGVCTYNTTTGGGATAVTKEAETVTMPVPGGTTISKTTQYTYDGYGNPTKIQENRYYTGTLPSTADRTTSITYLTTTPYFNANIVNLPTNVTVTNSSGGTVSQTLYTYDGSSIVSATGMESHDDTNYGTSYTVRGNLTQIQQLVSGSTYLTTSKTYDMTGQVQTSSDWNGNITTYSYTDTYYTDSGDGQTPTTKTVSPATNLLPTTITYPTVNSVTLKKKFGYYWGTGQVALSTDENSNTTYFHFYDPLNRPTSTALPNGGWTLVGYNSTDTEVDTYISTTNPTPSKTCTVCRHNQALLDGLGRVTTEALVNDPDGETYVATTYDSNGRVATVSNPYRSTSDPTYGLETPSYDGLDRTIQMKHADANIAHTYYGANVGTGGGATSQLCSSSTYGFGYPVLTVDEAGNKRQTWADGFGRTIETDEPGSNGSLTAGTCYSYDLNNNLLQVTSLGLTQTQKPTYTYDMLSRITSKTLPETGTTNFYYTTAIGGSMPCSGNPSAVCIRVAPLENQTSPSNTVQTAYAYDALNRIAAKFYLDSTWPIYYYYDQTGRQNSNGRLSSVYTYNAGVWLPENWFDYDSVGNVVTDTQWASWVANTYHYIYYTYNLDNSIASVVYPGGRRVTYTEGNAQRMTQAADSTDSISYVKSPSSGAMYSPFGPLANDLHGYVSGGFAGITESYSYNNRLEITGIEATSSAGTPLNLAYSYFSGNNGNISQQANNVSTGRTQTYTYDPLNRLLTAQTQAATGGDCWGQEFGNNATPPTLAADALANLFYATATQCTSPQPRFTMNTSNNNQFTGTGIGYDAAGNMTADTAYSYTYDAEGRVISVTGTSGGPYCYTYDAFGQRAMKSQQTISGQTCSSTGSNAPTPVMMYWRSTSGDTIAETDGTGSTTNANYNEYVFFAGRRIAQSNPSSGKQYYYFVDHLGSTRVVTTATGTACYEVDYLPFGTENTPAGFTNTCSTRYRFTGYERDAETAAGNSAGNDYALARFYNSRLGRFMSGDPLDGDVTNPQTLNHYAYVLDNPSNWVDPRGLFCGPTGCPPDDPDDPYDPDVPDGSGGGSCLGAALGGCGGTPAPPAKQKAKPANNPPKGRKINPKVLQDCINMLFGALSQGQIQVQDVTPSSPGGTGQITVQVPGFSGSTTVINDASTYSSAQIASMYPPGSLGPGQFYAGTTPPQNPFVNYTNNNNNAMGTVRSQVHEFGHSLYQILTADVDNDSPGYGNPLDQCVNQHGGYSQ